MTQRSFTEDDEGTTVVDADGNEIGIVSVVRDNQIYVNPDPGIADEIKAKLGWDSVDKKDYPVEAASIERATDDEIRLSREL